MDLGFAGLIEKIEEYFGKVVAAIFLAIVLLIALWWAVDLLISLYASGKHQWESGGDDAIIGLAKFIGVIIFITFLSYIAISVVGNRMLEKSKKEILNLQDRVNKQVDIVEEHYRKLDKARETVEGMLTQLKEEKKDKST